MAKVKSNTGFRNGDMFCFNCGGSYHMQTPQPVSMAAALMKQFAADHKKCEKTWEEPVNSGQEKSELENAKWWTENGERGMSSETMFNKLSKGLQCAAVGNPMRKSHPSDPDDFSRCYKLLQAVPQWKEKLHLMKTVSPEWGNLIENWDKLTEMYERNVSEKWKNYKSIGMYEFMKTLGC